MTEKTPAKRKNARSTSSNPDDPDQYNEEYRQKRMRNNEAVKKSREKTTKTANERKERVETLKKENIVLETKIQDKIKEIDTLKSLLLSKNDPENKKLIDRILADSDDSD